MFQIDPMSREPVYEQIIQQVQQFILTDVLQPGGQIPSVRSVSMTNSIFGKMFHGEDWGFHFIIELAGQKKFFPFPIDNCFWIWYTIRVA